MTSPASHLRFQSQSARPSGVAGEHHWAATAGNEQQQETIGKLEAKVAQLEEQVGKLDEQLKASKKLKGKPKIQPSKLNQGVEQTDKSGKRAVSDKRSK